MTDKKCKTCGIKLYYNNRSGYCRNHYFRDYGTCKLCTAKLSGNNRSGFCKNHRDRSGNKNPMAGKTVYEVWVKKYGVEEANRRKEKLFIKNSEASKKLWENDEYRKKIKETTTGVKRSTEFKEKQRTNAVKQMENIEQRQLRSDAIKRSFERGTHNPDTLASNAYGVRGFHNGVFYASKIELRRIKELNDFNVSWKRYQVTDFDFRIHYEWKGKRHLYLPDFVIKLGGKIIIEEIKYDLRYISEMEKAKIEVAKTILPMHGIQYNVMDKFSMKNFNYSVIAQN